MVYNSEGWFIMRLKFRLLYLTVLASFVLVACDSETMKDASIEEMNIQEESQVIENETADRLALKEATEPVENTAEESVVAETTAEEYVALEPKSQQAIDRLLAVTGIDLEDYIFLFSETADYIEIDIREAIDSDTTVAVGLYRYNLETNELLASDYLTGEFIPVEIAQ